MSPLEPFFPYSALFTVTPETFECDWVLALEDLQVIFTNEGTIDMYTKARKRAIDSKIGRLNAMMDLLEVPVAGMPTIFVYSLKLEFTRLVS